MALTRAKKLELFHQLDEKLGPDRSVVEFEFPDGWTVKRCVTYGDLCRVGELLSNCWANSFWHNPNKLRQYYWGAGMDEHFKSTWKGGRLEARHIRNPQTRRGYATKLERKRYFTLRDPDNIPRVAFFGTPGKGNVSMPCGSHNASIGNRLRNRLEDFQRAKGGISYF